jgi:hypothetical protein
MIKTYVDALDRLFECRGYVRQSHPQKRPSVIIKTDSHMTSIGVI